MSSCSSRLLVAFALSAVALVAGCGAEPTGEPEGTLATAEDAISGGSLDLEDKAVVGIVAKNINGICTGALIAPNLVLTARHCISELNNTDGTVDCSVTAFAPPAAADQYFVTAEPQMTQNPYDYVAVQEIVLLPTDDKLCGQDQAMLILKEYYDTTAIPAFVPRIDEPLVKGETYSAVGFGATDDTGAGAGIRRRRDDLTVGCVGDACPSFYVKPTEWMGDEGVCQGDSGGPALDAQDRLIGVTSRGGIDCTSPVYGDVLPWEKWLKETALHAAELGGYTAPAWATGWPTHPDYSYTPGEACESPVSCASKRCLDDGKEQYCTRLCTEKAPCPDGYFCDADSAGDAVCFKEAPPPKRTVKVVEAGSCSICADPTKPIPWRSGFFAVGFAAIGLRRRPR